MIEIKIGGQLKPGDTYALYIDGIHPGGPGAEKDTYATVANDNTFLLTFTIDKTQSTINGKKIFPFGLGKGIILGNANLTEVEKWYIIYIVKVEGHIL